LLFVWLLLNVLTMTSLNCGSEAESGGRRSAGFD
jgi:hypothetical protein